MRTIKPIITTIVTVFGICFVIISAVSTFLFFQRFFSHSHPPYFCLCLFFSFYSPSFLMFNISQMHSTILGAFRWPVRILCIYPLSTYNPVFFVISSSNHFWVRLIFNSSVFTTKPKSETLDNLLKIIPLSNLIVDKYALEYYNEGVKIHKSTRIGTVAISF